MRRSKKRFESSGRYDVATEHERIFHRVGIAAHSPRPIRELTPRPVPPTSHDRQPGGGVDNFSRSVLPRQMFGGRRESDTLRAPLESEVK
jgi:hypothetical protein